MSAAVRDLSVSPLESAGGWKSAGGGWRRMIFETASTAMRRRSGRRAIRDGRDLASCDPRGQNPWGQNPRGQDQRGFTLQTLIVTSIVVFLAIAVGFTLFAINAGSSEDLEEAGQIDAGGASCLPNEIFDDDYKSKGLGGPQGRHGVKSSQIGCRPHCATWEFMTAGPNDDGEYEMSKDWLLITRGNVGGPEGSAGGPENNGEVFSSQTGCFAPCYWEYISGSSRWVYPGAMRTAVHRLHYYDDNRVPAARQIRLGVIYRRGIRSDSNLYGTDYAPSASSLTLDGKRVMVFYTNANFGAVNHPGAPLPLPETQDVKLRSAGTVARPNWRTPANAGPDPGPGNRTGHWEDEDWEIRANPENKTCEIINPYRNDEIVCTSARDNCAD